MLQRILEFLTDERAPPETGRAGDLEDAVAALMIEAARMDDRFEAAERATIERLLGERFHLTPEEVRRLVADAERAVALVPSPPVHAEDPPEPEQQGADGNPRDAVEGGVR